MVQVLINLAIGWILYAFTAFVNVCIHELGHGIALKMLGLQFLITIGKGKKLFQITEHFIIHRNLVPFPYGYAFIYNDKNGKKYNNMSYKAKILYSSGGILIQVISIALIGILLVLKIGTEFIFLDVFYKFMVFTSVLLLLIVLLPSSKMRTDGYAIYTIIKEEQIRIKGLQDKDL